MKIRAAAILAFVLGLIATPLAAKDQPARRVYRIGFIASQANPYHQAFRDGLRELGYVEGQNLIVYYRYWKARPEFLGEVVAEMVRLNPDVIVAGAYLPVVALQRATSTIPIIGAFCDPAESLVASVAHPGGNVTGVTCVSSELSSKRLELIKDVAPKTARVGIVYNQDDPNKVVELKQSQVAAKVLHLSLQPAPIRGQKDLEGAFRAITRERAEAVVVFMDPVTIDSRREIAQFAARSRLLAVAGFREFTDAGGLMSYGAGLSDLFRRATRYVDRILQGAKPADLPIEEPTRFELIINRKTAKALGLTIPQSVLMRADEVIQ